MRLYWQKFQWSMLLVIVLMFIGGCTFFERDNPSAPASPAAQGLFFATVPSDLLANFVVAQSNSDHFQVFSNSPGTFQINLPKAGDFLLTYITEAGTWHLVFRATDKALVTIGIGYNDTFQGAALQEGRIRSGASPYMRSGPVSLYNWPAEPWERIFTLAGGSPSSSEPSNALITIAAVGNSITYGERSSNYPDKLQAKLRAAGYDVIVHNDGIPGDQSPATEDRFARVIQDVDIVLLMIGTNDVVVPGSCPRPYNCNTIGNIEFMLNTALSQGKIPLVSTVPPPRPTDRYAWADADVRRLNSQIKQLAARKYVVVADNYQAIRDSGYDALFSDRLHFNHWGYEIIADNWHRALINYGIIR